MALPALVVIAAPVLFTSATIAGIRAMVGVAGGPPIAANIRRTRPVTGVPVIARTERVPVSLHPRVVRARASRRSIGYRGWRRSVIPGCPNANLNRKAALSKHRTSNQQQQCQQLRLHLANPSRRSWCKLHAISQVIETLGPPCQSDWLCHTPAGGSRPPPRRASL